MHRSLAFCVLILATVLAPAALFASEATVPSNKILIVHDELPQMEVLAKFLREEGGLDVAVVEQSALPEDWSALRRRQSLPIRKTVAASSRCTIPSAARKRTTNSISIFWVSSWMIPQPRKTR